MAIFILQTSEVRPDGQGMTFGNVKGRLSPWISNTLSFLYSGSPLFTSDLIFGKLIIWVSISSSYVSYSVLSELNDIIYRVLEWSLPSTLKHSVNNYYHFQIKASKTDSCFTNTRVKSIWTKTLFILECAIESQMQSVQCKPCNLWGPEATRLVLRW